MTIRYKFYGWFTDNDNKGKEATYIYSQNINTTNSEYIQVSPKAKNLLNFWANEIDYVVPLATSSWCKDFFYVKDNKVYDKNKRLLLTYWSQYWQDPNAFDCVIQSWVVNLTFWGKWLQNAEKWQDGKKYWIKGVYDEQANVINMWTDLLWKDYFQVEFKKFLDFQSKKTHWQTYISYNDTVLNMWTDFRLATAIESLELDWIIIWIFWYGSGVRVYTDSWNLTIWDWVTENGGLQDSYELWIKINWVNNFNWVDYIFSRDWLYFLNWTIPQIIWYKNWSKYLDFQKFDFEYINTWFPKIKKFIFCATKNNWWNDLSVVWQRQWGFPINFSNIYYNENREKIIQIQPLSETNRGDNLWCIIFYKKKNGWYGIDYYSLENFEQFNDSWYIITKEYEWESLIFTKYARELKLYCDELKDNESLKIEASINWQDFFEIKTLTKNNSWKNGYYSILDFKREFHKIVFKLTLTWWFKLYDFVFYDNIKTT